MAKDSIKELEGQTVRDRVGTTIGTVEGVYLDEETDRPKWAVVRTGGPGANRFVPLSDAKTGGEDIHLAVTATRVEEAPEVREQQRLSPELEAQLHRHYAGGGDLEPAGSDEDGEQDSAAAARSRDRNRDRDRDRGDADRDEKGSPEERQRDEYGGFNLGASLLGWLVAAGIAIFLTAIVSAAGGAIGLTKVSASEAEAVSIVGGVVLLLVLMAAYFTGGYNAGRLSRFDGGRQGFGVWLVGLLITIALAVAGLVFGSEYNVLERLDLPRIPIDEGSLATGGIITLVAVVLGTLLAAILGGKAGERYHKKVDRAGQGR